MSANAICPYPAYKPSGVPWLGNVPAHWEVVQLGRIGIFSKGSGGTKDDEVPDGIPCVRYGDLYTTHKSFINQTRSYVSPAKASAYTPINRGDVLFPTSGETIEEIGKSAVNLMHTQVLCGGDLIIFRPTVSMEPKFAGYALDCPAAQTQKSLMGRGITIMHIYSGQLKYLWFPLPPLPEQRAIVRYLDYVDRRIRRYVSAKRRLIALLEEEKQAIVNQAVTRGLDPNVPLKPSGVEWLGDVPEHWEVRRGKRLFSPRRELARPEDIQLSATQAYGVIPQDEYEERIGRRIVKISLHLNQRRHVEVDDFVISMRSFQGGLERAWATGCIRSSYIVLRPTIEVDVEFFSYVLKSQAYIQALRSTANFIRDGQDLTFNNFCAVDLPFPAAEEQRRIAVAIGEATANIDATIARARRQIELLQEYRTRLIADVVTGKLDVREAAAQLPDEPDDEEPIDEGRALADDADGDLYDAGNFKEQLAMESEVRA